MDLLKQEVLEVNTTENIFKDSFSKVFKDINIFIDFLYERENNSEWFRIPSNYLSIIGLDTESEMTNLFYYSTRNEVIQDTKCNSNLLIMTDCGVFPLRDTSIKTLLERAKINGTALGRLKRSIFAEIVNHCLDISKGEALLKIQDEKVSAIHGGDDCDYAILNIREIFEATESYLNTEFPDNIFKSGYYDHSITSGLWDLSQENELIREYKELLEHHGIELEIKPAIRVSSSDVGILGANIYPIISLGDKNIVLGSILKLNHKNKADIDNFKTNLSMIFSQFSKGIDSLKKLMDIRITNTRNCMGNIMKKIALPKKHSLETIELFTVQNGDKPASAHDIFYAISEILFIMQREDEPTSRIISTEENISRALSLKWSDYDMYGEFKW